MTHLLLVMGNFYPKMIPIEKEKKKERQKPLLKDGLVFEHRYCSAFYF